MTSTPELLKDEALADSWVDLGDAQLLDMVPLELSFNTSEMQNLLREAQRNFSPTSFGSGGESSRNSSPKSPPNSPEIPPNTPKSPESNPDDEMLVEDGQRNIYVNPNRDDAIDKNYWVYEWSSRPDQEPPKEWKFHHPTTKSSCLSMRHSKVMKRGLFSAEVFSILMLTNLVSLLLGAGLGFYIGKRLGTGVVSSLD